MRTIKNGTRYPKAVKNAALKAWKDSQRSAEKIGADCNVAGSTVTTWVREAAIQRGTQHPNLKAANAIRFANSAQIKAYNTPTAQPDGTIMYKGKIYR